MTTGFDLQLKAQQQLLGETAKFQKLLEQLQAQIDLKNYAGAHDTATILARCTKLMCDAHYIISMKKE